MSNSPDSSVSTAQSTSRGRRIMRGLGPYLASLLSGMLMALAFVPYDWCLLVWIALLPLLSLLWLGPAGFWRGFRLGFCYGMGYYCLSFWWIHEVGIVFGIPMPIFLGIAFFPLMAVYSCLPALWAGLLNRFLRPIDTGDLQSPATEALPQSDRKKLWSAWAKRDLLSGIRCAVGAAALWVCVEWLRAHGTLGFSWNSLGMALYDGLSLAQWAEFVGTSALSFLPVAMSVILWRTGRRCYLYFKGTASHCRPWDFYAAVILLFALFTGGLSLAKYYSPLVQSSRKGCIQLPVVSIQLMMDQQERISSPPSLTLYEDYLAATGSAFRGVQQASYQKALQHPDLAFEQKLPAWVIWPESAMAGPFWRNTASGELLKDQASQYFFGPKALAGLRQEVQQMGGPNFVLFSGVDEVLLDQGPEGLEPHGMLNSMAVMPAGFESIRTVSKQHLMPFGEYIPLADSCDWLKKLYSDITGTQVGDGIRPGTGDEPIYVPLPGTKEELSVIPAVCYEDTVGDLLCKFVRKGPQIIVNVTNDAWFRKSCCGEQQARSAAFRCIELRRPMVRAANMGVCCAIAANGAPIHELRAADGSPHVAGYSYAVVPIAPEAGITLFARYPDAAVLLCALAALLCCALPWRCKAIPRV